MILLLVIAIRVGIRSTTSVAASAVSTVFTMLVDLVHAAGIVSDDNVERTRARRRHAALESI